ncbi:hypothetical protein BT69DRAFT_1256238 [Atractiella rhizophila]|nr:hypothetical protein BT69DRAFT_1256238 [Atractiella rhizophila]
MLQLWSLPCSAPSDFSPSTDSSEEGREMRLEVGLILDGVEGEPFKIKWRPFGTKEKRVGLGMVAAAWTDGSTYLLHVPRPERVKEVGKVKEEDSVFLKIKPALKLRINDSTAKCLCVDWASSDTLAIGLTNGWVAVYAISALLSSQPSVPLPTHYFPLHEGPIRAIKWQKYADINGEGEETLDEDPTTLVTASTDGAHKLVDIRDPVPIPILVERVTHQSATWSSWLGSPLMDDADAHTRQASIRPVHFVLNRVVSSHRGSIWELAASDCQPFIASASADGTLSIFNTLRDLKRHHHVVRYIKKVYRIDFNRLTLEYRMLDNILPEERQDQRAVGRKMAKKKEEEQRAGVQDVSMTGAWPEQIGVTACAWHPSLRRFALVASGMACGLVRVDWTEI